MQEEGKTEEIRRTKHSVWTCQDPPPAITEHISYLFKQIPSNTVTSTQEQEQKQEQNPGQQPVQKREFSDAIRSQQFHKREHKRTFGGSEQKNRKNKNNKKNTGNKVF